MIAMSSRNGEGTSLFRQVTVKILYTFDDQNKTNHLVRLPQLLSVQTFAMRPTSTIGIIDLPTCLQAIIEASPELAANTGKDYSIYVYDYSEENSPLVGQGMLSKVLAATFETHLPSSSTSTKLITGKISDSTTEIFSNGAKETLEVRFRLVPLFSGMGLDHHKRRDSHTLHLTSKSNQWASSLELNPAVVPFNAISSNAIAGQTNLESSMDGGSPPEFHLQDQASPYLTIQRLTDNSGNESFATEAKLSAKKGSRHSTKVKNKRPRGRKPKLLSTRVSGNISSFEGVTDDDGSAPNKKVKLQKSDRKAKSTINKSSNSLIDASVIPGSRRLLRPIAMAPSSSLTVNYQHNVTRNIRLSSSTSRCCIPDQQTQLNQRPRENSNSAQVSSRSQLLPDKSEDLLQYSIESLQDSPERISSPFDTDTPPGMTSSPPLIKSRAPSSLRSSPPCSSSPILPQNPRTDSGFMSGPLEEIYDQNKLNLQPVDEACILTTDEICRNSLPTTVSVPNNQAQTEFIIEECPGPMDRLPTTVPIFYQQARARSAVSFTENSKPESVQKLPQLKKPPRVRNEANLQNKSPIFDSFSPEEVMPPKRLKPVSDLPIVESWSRSQTATFAASNTSNSFSKTPASDPVPPPSGRQRSQIWAGNVKKTEINTSIIPPMAQYNSLQPLTTGNNTLTISQSSSKKEMIRQRLEMAIANGETPQFCCNCGAIKTPTWRKAWSKEMIGEPAYCEYSDEPGRVTAIIILTRDAEGKPTSYHLIKKYLGDDESQDDYNEYILCNPCGIWMSKYKTARPEERWESNTDRTSREPKKRPTQRISKSKKVQSCAPVVPTSEENFLPSDKYFSAPEISNPPNESMMRSEFTLSLGPIGAPKCLISEQDSKKKEGAVPHEKLIDSVIKSDEAPVTQKSTIKSSPTKWVGTQESPIDLEDDPQDIRRLLFPSPMKDSSPKLFNKTENGCSVELAKIGSYPPQADSQEPDAAILQLLGEEPTKEIIKRPTTPVQCSPSTSFRTPDRQAHSLSKSDRSIKSPGQLLVFSHTPGSSHKHSPHYLDGALDSPFTTTLNQLISEANNYSPSQNFNYDSLAPLPETNVGLDLNTNYSLNDFFTPVLSNSPSDPNIEAYETVIENISGLTWDNFEDITLDLEAQTQDNKVKAEPFLEENPSDPLTKAS